MTTYRLTQSDRPVSPTLERFLTSRAASIGKQIWQKVTKMRLEVKEER
jgi:hypothetical protein